MENVSLKELIDRGYVVFCDTNVYLRIYDYSPEFAVFAINCLSEIKESLYLTYTSFLEYKKHYMSKYASAKTKIENYDKRLNALTTKYREDILKEFERIQQYHFPDIDSLQTTTVARINELTELFSEYYDEHELLVAINDQYLIQDPIKCFIDLLSQRILPSYTIEKIYELCDEGQKRFKNKVPPGFKDKDKHGIRQYSDFILWSEIIDYSNRNKRNVVFVTDDVKVDWWASVENDNSTSSRVFHPELIAEFEKKTGQKIVAYTSNDLFSAISLDYGVDTTDAVNLALEQTIDDYVCHIKYKAFERIQDEITYCPTDYINDMFADIGSEGLEDCEIEYYELCDYALIERNDTEMIYMLSFQVSLSATSYDYWGRDDDTKEIITSPPNEHIFEGIIKLQVTRVVDDFVDLLYDNSFREVFIISGELEQTSFKNGMEEDEPYESGGNYCPKCGEPLTFDNDALNGFCFSCTEQCKDI